MQVLENKPIADSPPQMGRPPLGVKPTTVRLPLATINRIEAFAGKQKVAGFIREAVAEKLERSEKTAK